MTFDKDGNCYLDQKRSIEGVVKAAKLSGATIQKLPYPLDVKSLSKEDNAKDDSEVREVAKTPIRATECLVTSLDARAGHSLCPKRTIEVL